MNTSYCSDRIIAPTLTTILGIVILSTAWAQQSPDSTAAHKPVSEQAGASAKTNIAVVTLRNSEGVSASEATLITDRLNAELFRTGVVTILERTQMADILKEQGFQQSGACSDDACMVQMGQLLGVKQLVSGSIGQLGSIYLINLRLISVETGQVVRIVSEDVKGSVEDVVRFLPRLSRSLMGLAPGTAIEAATNGEAPAPEIPVKKPSVNSGMVIALSNPAGAEVFINNRKVGVTPFEDNTLLPGACALTIKARRYEEYSETFDLPAGTTRKVAANLRYLYGVLTVESKPQGASVNLNERGMGVTPVRNDSIAPGTYRLQLSLSGYQPIDQRVEILQGHSDTLSFALFTKTYLDSAKRATHAMNLGKRNARRIIFGILAAGAWGAGVYFNSLATHSIAQENTAWNTYSNDQSGNSTRYAHEFSQYQDAISNTHDKTLERNIFYGIGGVFTAAFGLSIPF